MNRILVIDGDDAAIRLLYTDELTEEGYEVITREGDSGLMELIEKKRPDLVVLDMPPGEHDGLSLYQDIRSAYDELPVILSTVYAAGGSDAISMVHEPRVGRSSGLNELKLAIRQAVEGREPFSQGAMVNSHAKGQCDSLQGRV